MPVPTPITTTKGPKIKYNLRMSNELIPKVTKMNENSGSDVYVKVKELSQKDAAKSTTEDVS